MDSSLNLPSFLVQYEPERKALSLRVQKFIDQLPPGLREAALSFSTSYKLTAETLAWPSIYFLLPFWLHQEIGGCCTLQTSEVAFANACLTYSNLIEDRVLDDGAELDIARDLGIANAFFLEGILAYNAIFPSNPDFWRNVSQFMQASWNSLILEKAQHRSLQAEELVPDEVIQRNKINVGKIAILAITLLEKRPETADRFYRYLDHWQLGCQMMDDFADFKDDLRCNNYTQFIKQTGVSKAVEDPEGLVERWIGSGGLETYFDEIVDHYVIALSTCLSSDGPLSKHAQYLIDDAKRVRTQSTALRAMIADFLPKPGAAISTSRGHD